MCVCVCAVGVAWPNKYNNIIFILIRVPRLKSEPGALRNSNMILFAIQHQFAGTSAHIKHSLARWRTHHQQHTVRHIPRTRGVGSGALVRVCEVNRRRGVTPNMQPAVTAAEAAQDELHALNVTHKFTGCLQAGGWLHSSIHLILRARPYPHANIGKHACRGNGFSSSTHPSWKCMRG